MSDILEIDSTGSIDFYTDPVEVIDSQTNIVVVDDPVISQGLISDNSIDIAPDQEDETDNSDDLSENEDVDSVSVSNDDIINVLKEINENVQKGVTVSSDDISNFDNDQVIGVSQNEILTKNLSDYTVSESLQLMMFLTLLISGLVFIIRKGLYKWI